MSNPLLLLLYRIVGRDPEEPEPLARRLPMPTAAQASATVFLVLRRMRVPLIVVIVIFAVSVLGLMVIPGEDETGAPTRMGMLHAFYVMSYTATTIGFGEIPHEFTELQRSWVILSIYLSVIGWAYAIGTLFGLLQDRDFRHALTVQRFVRKVRRLSEPFLLLAGHGQTGQLLGDSLDALDRRFVVLDVSSDRIADLDRDAYRFDVPGLAADPARPGNLLAAGLAHARCAGVLALTDDDDANLAVTMAAGILRPDVPIIARAFSPRYAERMRAFSATVINPFDAFGDHLRLAVQSPAAYQLQQWLTGLPGDPMPRRRAPLAPGRWVVCGYGRFGQEVTADLRASGVEVTVVDAGTTTSDDPAVIVVEGTERDMMAAADVAGAAGVIAANDDDVANLALVTAARRVNPDVFIVARQNSRADESLFRAAEVDLVLVPPEVTAHEVLARLGSPVLLRFLQQVPRRGEAWAAGLVARLADRAGRDSLVIWQVDLDRAPELAPWLATGAARLGDLLRDPLDRERPLGAVALMVVRGEQDLCSPDDDLVLLPGDSVLLAGRAGARQDLENITVDDATREYVLHGRVVPSGWVWRRVVAWRAGRGVPATGG